MSNQGTPIQSLYGIVGIVPERGLLGKTPESVLERLMCPDRFNQQEVEFVKLLIGNINGARQLFERTYQCSTIDSLSCLYNNHLNQVHLDGMLNLGNVLFDATMRNEYNKWLKDGRLDYGGEWKFNSDLFGRLEKLFRYIGFEGRRRLGQKKQVLASGEGLTKQYDSLLEIDNQKLPPHLNTLHSFILEYDVQRFRELMLNVGVAQAMAVEV